MHKNLFLIFIFLLSLFSLELAIAGENISRQFKAKAYSGSRDRDYILHLPDGYDASKPVPLVMVLHGCSQTNRTIQNDTDFDSIADKEGFAVVYPFVTSYQGLRNTNCWGFWFDEEIHEDAGEVQDLKGIIKDIQADFSVDANRIHVTGLSSGAAMAIAVMVAHSEIIASGGETAGLPYGETAASVGFSCANSGSFKPVSAVANAMDNEMSAGKRPVPIFIVHSKDDCTVNIQAARNVRDSWGKVFGVDTGTADFSESGSTSGTPWTHEKFFDDAGQSMIETLFISGKSHGWYGGRDGQFAFKDAPDTAQLFWDFFKAHPLNANVLPEVQVTEVSTHDDRCITIVGSASDEDGLVTSVNVAFEGVFPQAPKKAEFNGKTFTYTKCQLRDNAAYTPFVEVQDDKGGVSSTRGQAIVMGKLPANTPPQIIISKESSEGSCAIMEGTAVDDKQLVSVEVRLNDGVWNPATVEGSDWKIRVCALQPGSYDSQVRATDNEKLTATALGKGIIVEAGFESVETTNLTGHLAAQRLRYYENGFGAADKTYLTLLNEHGVSGTFPLYLSSGDWYSDSDNVPITSSLRQTVNQAEIKLEDNCMSLSGTIQNEHLQASSSLLEYRFGNEFWQPAFLHDDHFIADQCGLADGLNPVSLRITDSSGNSSSLSMAMQQSGDNQPPEMQIQQASMVGDCLVISGVAEDDAEVKKVRISLDDTNWQEASLTGKGWYFDECGISQIPEQIRVRAVDGRSLFMQKNLR